ncbi:MAG: thioesterase [Catenulispora sp.]|nr:thioesterase [Catenulispora sp.]
MPDAPLRLFCFPHAGGGAGFFRPWRLALQPDVEVCAVVLPGREGRLRETPYVRMTHLLGPLTEALADHIDRPYAILGHSTGAAVGFEAARRLSVLASAPRCLVVSGRRAPGPPEAVPRYLLPDEQFLDQVAALGGTPPELLARPDLLDLFLPSLRADFELNETYAQLPGDPLPCPVVAMAGEDDPEVSAEQMVAWRRFGTGPFALHVFPGDHFFLSGAPAAAVRVVRAALAGTAVAGAGRV